MIWLLFALIFAVAAGVCEWVVRRQDAAEEAGSRVNRRVLDRINRNHPHGE